MNDHQTLDTNRISFYVALLTTILTLITFGIAVMTPPISGPACPDDRIEYPYLDITDRFPRDYYWMYFAMVLTLAYVALMACIHQHAAPDRKLFSQIGLAFAIIAAAPLVINYFVQVSVIQPSLLNGETEGIPLWTQYNPHGLFIALEEVGYLVMSVSFLAVAFVFPGANSVEKALRWTLIGACVLTLIALVGIEAAYGTDREYRFEIIVITINWFALVVAGGLLSYIFRQAMYSA